MRIILASRSPRRKEILENLGVEFEQITEETDESSSETDPCKLVEELSYRKGKAVCDKTGDTDTLIISADTVVAVDGTILGKPKDKTDAFSMLKLLSDNTHSVVSGVTLMYNGKTVTAHEITKVTFAEMTDDVIKNYIQTNEPMDKAGAYAVQGLASMMIKGIDGCYFNVVGFPVHRFAEMLKAIGIDPYSITKLK